MSYTDAVTEDRRLLILRALSQANGYTASARLLNSFLKSFGQNVSHDLVVGELAWLAEQRLVELRLETSESIATLTVRGLDVVSGAAKVPGVRRPMPGEA